MSNQLDTILFSVPSCEVVLHNGRVADSIIIGKEALNVLTFHRFFVGGVRIAIDASIQASVLAEDQLQTVLEAAIYQAHEIPSDYLPRYNNYYDP